MFFGKHASVPVSQPIAVQPSVAELEQSVGHIAFIGRMEYYVTGDQVYAAPIDNVMDVRTSKRFGRWECSVVHWEHFNRLEALRQIYRWAH